MIGEPHIKIHGYFQYDNEHGAGLQAFERLSFDIRQEGNRWLHGEVIATQLNEFVAKLWVEQPDINKTVALHFNALLPETYGVVITPTFSAQAKLAWMRVFNRSMYRSLLQQRATLMATLDQSLAELLIPLDHILFRQLNPLKYRR